MSGPLEPALQEFRDAEEVMPYSGWLHYQRGLCLAQHGKNSQAIESLQLALGPLTSSLNRPKRDNAERLLAELRV
jgi:tetratricopeptide (TPR) repeat protein